jgi:hypothetical protein
MTETPILASEMSDDELKAELEARASRRRAQIAANRPAVIEVLLTEGGQWIIWAPNALRIDPEQEKKGNYHSVHAIKFDDGSIWDVANGWRG